MNNVNVLDRPGIRSSVQLRPVTRVPRDGQPLSACLKRLEIEFSHGAKVGISVEKLTGRFALPCAWEQVSGSLMRPYDWFLVRQIAFSGSLLNGSKKFDSQKFLGGLFPNLVKTFHGDWSHENVLKALLEHKGHAEECAAKVVTIGRLEGNRRSPITGDDRLIFTGWEGNRFVRFLSDLYCLSPQDGSKVLVHKSTIVTLL